MNLESLGEELKKRRLDKQISLVDISAETRINQKFLEAIEQGNFSVLPQTYVRAFLREYAQSVGLNPEEFMKRYDATRREGQSGKVVEPATASHPSRSNSDSGVRKERRKAPTPLQKKIALGFVGVAAIAVTLLLTNSNSDSGAPKATREISFDRVVKETEATSVKPDPIPVQPAPIIPPKVDSLRLEISTTDSVWMSILIDGKRTEEHLFGPNRKKIWIAKDQFTVTMGNAGGATFQLNGKDIGALGRRGAVIRNTVISEAILKNL